ncbi:MAG TPA: glucoamylase family protein [Lacipirellulaceae bacterium]|nr:glucoamylase family protein [Lacipirellulaceae bacterium]
MSGFPHTRRRFLAAAGTALPLAYAAARPRRAFAQSPSPSAIPGSTHAHAPAASWAEALLVDQREAFDYFLRESNPANGLVPDNVRVHQRPRTTRAPASIAAVGFGLVAYVVGVERGFMTRAEAVRRTLATLRFFAESPHGPEPDATGYRGFYYHFLDMDSGRRVWQCELSTVDTADLWGGMRSAAAYFGHDDADEHEIRRLADELYRRVDWTWALNGGATVSHGWTPESGFLQYRWQGYDEALLLYILGLGSPTHPLPAETYAAWTRSYEWKEIYGHEFLYAGPLFIHQYSHMWIDFRGIRDRYMGDRGLDYFENSRRATLVHQQYAISNPLEFEQYGAHFWGLTASDGPGWTQRRIRGIDRNFYDYLARGAPYGPDDGTIAPWAVLASLPFAPEIVQATLENLRLNFPEAMDRYCFKCSFNPTYTAEEPHTPSWTSEYHFGINLGPIVMMVENHLTGLPWDLMRTCPYVLTGLRRAGFTGGWL